MKKFYTKNGKEVKMGDKIVTKMTTSTEYGNIFTKECILVTESSIPYLLDNGLITIDKKEKKENKEILTAEVCFNKIVSSLSNQLEFDNVGDTLKFMDNLYNVNLSAFKKMMLKKIAVQLDRKYPDHIQSCEQIWIFNSLYNTIDTLNTNKSLCFDNFAAFRSKEDAKLAISILNEIVEWGKNDN